MMQTRDAVLTALLDHHDGAATVAWLCAYTGRSPDAVQRALTRLEADHLTARVGIVRPWHPSGGRPATLYAPTTHARRTITSATTDPMPTPDTLLQQLTELATRRARVRDIDAATRDRLATLLTGLPAHPQFGNASPVVQGACGRIADAWRSDALRLIAKRDVEVVRSFLATGRLAA